MIKTLSKARKQERVKFRIPRNVQDCIPIRRIWADGIFQVGHQFSKTWSFTDINYSIAGKDDNKGSRWIAQRYFHRIGNRTWTFSVQWRRTDGSTGYYALEYASDVKIARYPKIQDGANP